MVVQYWGATAGWRHGSDNVHRASGEHAELLVANAEKDPAAWDAATTMAAWLLERGEAVPSVLAGFAAAVLRGKVRRPKESADGFTQLSRDLPLCMAISMLLEVGFSRSEGKSTDAPYVLAVVSELAAELGHTLGADMLEKIWQRHGEHVSRAAGNPFYFCEEPGNFPLSRPPARSSRSKVRQK